MTQRDHSECLDRLRRGIAEQGFDVTLSIKPPVVIGAYTVDPLVCPHGIRFWLEPTGEQIAEWAAEGVA